MRNYWKEWKNTILIGVGIFILAFFLRLYNLTSLPIFGDEAIYIRWAQVMGAEPGLRFLPLSDGKQPAFMWVLMFLVRRFSDPLFIGRLTSVFYGMGTFLGIFVLTYYLFRSKKLALISSLIYAISPFSVFFDRVALVDSMLTMFGVWTLFFAVVTAKTLRLDMAILAGFALGGALLTKSPAIFFVILLPAAWLVSKWPKNKKLISPFAKRFGGSSVAFSAGGHLIKLATLLSVTVFIGYAMFNILRLGENFHMLSIRDQDYIYPISHIFTSPLDPLRPFLIRISEYFWLMGSGVLVFLFLAGVYLGLKIRRREALLLLAWGVLPIFAVAEFSRTMTARYIYFSIPYLLILAALPLVVIGKGKKVGVKLIHLPGGIGSHLKILVDILLIFFVIHALYIDFQLLTNIEAVPLPRSERSGYLEEWTAGTGIREVSEIIREVAKDLSASRRIVVGTEGHFGTLPDGLQAYLNDLPEVTVIGVGIDLMELPRPLVESSASGNKTYLVINKSRLKTAPQDLDLELIAVYPKAFRPDGTRDALYLFELSTP